MAKEVYRLRRVRGWDGVGVWKSTKVNVGANTPKLLLPSTCGARMTLGGAKAATDDETGVVKEMLGARSKNKKCTPS